MIIFSFLSYLLKILKIVLPHPSFKAEHLKAFLVQVSFQVLSVKKSFLKFFLAPEQTHVAGVFLRSSESFLI